MTPAWRRFARLESEASTREKRQQQRASSMRMVPPEHPRAEPFAHIEPDDTRPTALIDARGGSLEQKQSVVHRLARQKRIELAANSLSHQTMDSAVTPGTVAAHSPP